MIRNNENEVFCTIQWSIDDLEKLFERHGIPFTKANIDGFLKTGAAKILSEETIQQGWEILEQLVFNFVLNEQAI